MSLQTKQRRPKNRLPMKGEDLQRRSAYSIRLFLKNFCVEFVGGSYNALMYRVKVGAFI
jgi:timeless